MESVSVWEIEKGKSEGEAGREAAWLVFILAIAQGDVEDRDSFHRGNKSFVENSFVLTGGPSWARMWALRGHFGLGGMGTRFVEVEVLLKERLPMQGSCEERFLLSRKKYSRGVAQELVVVQSKSASGIESRS
jgi:hypothetical protein